MLKRKNAQRIFVGLSCIIGRDFEFQNSLEVAFFGTLKQLETVQHNLHALPD